MLAIDCYYLQVDLKFALFLNSDKIVLTKVVIMLEIFVASGEFD